MAELDVRHLRVIHAIGETGSLTRAAARLGMSQPALSGQLARIEQSIGGRLFTRSPRGTEPTPLGQFILGRAGALLADMEALSSAARRQARDSGERVSLRVGTTPLFLVDGFLKRLRQGGEFQQISSLNESSDQVVLRLLAARHVDVGLCTRSDDLGPEDLAGLRVRTVAREPVLAALADSHPLAGCDEISLADLADCDWVMPPPPDNPIRQRLLAACYAAGYTPRLQHFTNDSTTARMLVLQGAVTLVAGASRSRGGIVVRPLAGHPLIVELLFATSAGGLADEAAARLYRAAAQAYLETIDHNPYLRRWWTEHPESHREIGLAPD